jgi:tetratricopeptide (TPR) repeat protein
MSTDLANIFLNKQKQGSLQPPWFVPVGQGGLPNEIVLHILSYFSLKELVVVSRLNKFCKQLFDDKLKLSINYFGSAFSLTKEHVLSLSQEIKLIGGGNFGQAPSEEQERFFNSVVSNFILPLFNNYLNDRTVTEIVKSFSHSLKLNLKNLPIFYGTSRLQKIIEYVAIKFFITNYGMASDLKRLPLLIQNKCIDLLFKDVNTKDQTKARFDFIQLEAGRASFSVSTVFRALDHAKKYGMQDELITKFKTTFNTNDLAKFSESHGFWVFFYMAKWAFDNEDNQAILELLIPKLDVTNAETMQKINRCFSSLKKGTAFFKGVLKEVDLIYVLLRLNPLNIDVVEKLVLEKEGEKSDHYFSLSKAFLKLGNKQKALELLNKKPNKTTGVFFPDLEDRKRTTILLAKIDFEAAKKFIDSQGAHNDLLPLLAHAYCKIGKSEEAKKVLEAIKKHIIDEDAAIICTEVATKLNLNPEQVNYFMRRINHPNSKIKTYLKLFDLAKTKEEKQQILNKVYEVVLNGDRFRTNFPLLLQFLHRTEQYVQDAFRAK